VSPDGELSVVMSEGEVTLEETTNGVINESDHEKPRWYAPELKTGLKKKKKNLRFI
jgi:hypothetical protein